MTEADEKRLAGLRAIYAGEPDDVVGAFLLRRLDTERADRARLEKERESWRISAAELSREYLARATQAESALAAECEKSMRLEAALRAGRNALRDANPAGKTIVDFLNVWLDQMGDRAREAESALAAARERVALLEEALTEIARLSGIQVHKTLLCEAVEGLARAALTLETP